MSIFIKEGIQRIKDTKTYAREKNVVTWINDVLMATMLVTIMMAVVSMYGMVIVAEAKNSITDGLLHSGFAWPFILTFLFMMRFGQYPIKLMILKSFYMQKAMLKLINKLDMYLWRKTGKDGMATTFIMKYRIPVQLIFYVPIIIALIFF